MMTYYGYGYYGEGDEVYRATITGLRISAVDGTAFLDACAALVPYADGKHKVEIYSGSYMAAAYLKAQGTIEGLGNEKLSNPSFDSNTTGWTGSDCTLASVAGGQSNNCLEVTRTSGDSQTAASGAATLTSGWLVKTTAYVKSGTTGNQAYTMLLSGSYITGTSSGSWVQREIYRTATSNHSLVLRKDSNSAGTMLFDEASAKQVLTPSADGVTLVSAREGDQYNFAYKHASFPWNQASYTVIVKKVR